jgi:hypothetical protein
VMSALTRTTDTSFIVPRSPQQVDLAQAQAGLSAARRRSEHGSRWRDRHAATESGRSTEPQSCPLGYLT